MFSHDNIPGSLVPGPPLHPTVTPLPSGGGEALIDATSNSARPACPYAPRHALTARPIAASQRLIPISLLQLKPWTYANRERVGALRRTPDSAPFMRDFQTVHRKSKFILRLF